MTKRFHGGDFGDVTGLRGDVLAHAGDDAIDAMISVGHECFGELEGGLVAIGGGARKDLLHDVRKALWDIRALRSQVRNVGREDFVEDLREFAGLGRKRRCTGEHLVEQCAHGVEIGALVDVLR